MRVLLRILSPLLGLLLALIGLDLVIEVVGSWVAPQSAPVIIPWTSWRPYLDQVTWQANAIRAVAIVVGVIGLLVVLVGLVGRRHDVFLSDPVPEVTVTTSPRSLARAVGHEVRSHDDVMSAAVVASSSKITVKAATMDAPDSVRSAVRERVDSLLERLPLARRPRVSVSVSVHRGVR